MSEDKVRSIVREHIAKAGGVRSLSRDWGVSAGLISDTALGNRPPSPKILGILGITKVETYRKYESQRAGKGV